MPVLPVANAAALLMMPLEPNAEDPAGGTVRFVAPVLPATIAATDPNTGTQRCSPPVDQSLAGTAELSVELAQLATSAATVMVMLIALGIGSEFANVPRKVLMRRVVGQIESLEVRSACAVWGQLNIIFNTCLRKYT